MLSVISKSIMESAFMLNVLAPNFFSLSNDKEKSCKIPPVDQFYSEKHFLGRLRIFHLHPIL
jgi:hypothetical protein